MEEAKVMRLDEMGLGWDGKRGRWRQQERSAVSTNIDAHDEEAGG